MGLDLFPTARPLNVQQRLAALFRWVLGLQMWGAVTDPTGHALLSWCCALRGWQEGARGDASCLCEGRLGLGAHPALAARPSGVQWRTAARGCGSRCAGVVARHGPFGFHALRGIARRGNGRRLPGGGAALTLVQGGLWLVTHPPPAARLLGRQPGSAAHRRWVHVCRRGDPPLAPLACMPFRTLRNQGAGGEWRRRRGLLAVVRGVYR